MDEIGEKNQGEQGGTAMAVRIIRRRDVGNHVRLLEPERFRSELAKVEEYYDAFNGREAPRRGRRSRALNVIMTSKCGGWDELPTGADLHDAFHAEEPTDRQIVMIRTFFREGNEELLIQAWAQQAFSHRTLVQALHRAGCTTGNTLHSSLLIRLINQWAVPEGTTDKWQEEPRL